MHVSNLPETWKSLLWLNLQPVLCRKSVHDLGHKVKLNSFSLLLTKVRRVSVYVYTPDNQALIKRTPTAMLCFRPWRVTPPLEKRDKHEFNTRIKHPSEEKALGWQWPTEGMDRRSSAVTLTSRRSWFSWLSPWVWSLKSYTRWRNAMIILAPLCCINVQNLIQYLLSAWALSNSGHIPWNHPRLPWSLTASAYSQRKYNNNPQVSALKFIDECMLLLLNMYKSNHFLIIDFANFYH